MANNVDRYLELGEHTLIDHTGIPGVGGGGGGDAFPIGAIASFGGLVAAIPPGWLACDGFAYGRTGLDANPQQALFDVIGTTWGIGNGVTTFNIPDLRGRVAAGVNDVTLPNGIAGGLSVRQEADVDGFESASTDSHVEGDHAHTGVTLAAPAFPFQGGVDDFRDIDNPSNHVHSFTTDLAGGFTHEHDVSSFQPTTFANYIIKAQQLGGGVGGVTAQSDGGALAGAPRPTLNFVSGTGSTFTVTDSVSPARIDIQLDAGLQAEDNGGGLTPPLSKINIINGIGTIASIFQNVDTIDVTIDSTAPPIASAFFQGGLPDSPAPVVLFSGLSFTPVAIFILAVDGNTTNLGMGRGTAGADQSTMHMGHGGFSSAFKVDGVITGNGTMNAQWTLTTFTASSVEITRTQGGGGQPTMYTLIIGE